MSAHLVAALLAAALVVPGTARADALQDQVLAGIRAASPEAFAFTRTTSVERSGAATRTTVARFDPRKAADARWTLVSVDGRAPTADERKKARAATRGPVPSYAELGKWFGAPATRRDGGDGRVIYAYPRLPAGTLTLGKHDASADTSAEAVVNTLGAKPFVEEVRLRSTRSFRMALVAAVKSMTATTRYRLTGGGRPVPVETVSDVAGSLLGKAGRLGFTLRYSDWASVR